MTEPDDFRVRFWGVRGSFPCPGPDTVRYGGNTACLEVRCGAATVVLDCGTGARPLGERLMAEGRGEADILFSHTHLDHVMGLPFFRPAQHPESRLRLWSGGAALEAALRALMAPPLFPIPPEALSTALDRRAFSPGETLALGPGIEAATAPLNHPGGATGYRLEFAGRSLCYATDTEHVPGRPDAAVRELAAGANVLVYDCTFTDAEFPRFRGWGHSTWEEGVRLADAAGVGTLVVFHHDPFRDDAAMDAIAGAVARARPGAAVVAREGMELAP